MLETNVVIFQSCAIVIIALVAALGGWIPYMFSNSKKFDTIMSNLNCASGGVLMGVALLHIFPETGETLNAKSGGFPLSYCVTFIGIMLMVIMLKIGHNHQHGEHDHSHDHSHEHEETVSLVKEGDVLDDCECGHDHEHETEPPKKKWQAVIMLMIGLFIHDVSEGFALGFTQELMPGVYLFSAIILHKWCDVTCQVICGIREGLTKKENIYTMIPLVLASPVAELIAFLIVLNTDNAGESVGLKITEDIFMSFACGTFLAICFVEIIGQEFNSEDKKKVFIKASYLLAGFTIVAISSIVEAVTEEE
ncbi:ZIP_zinc transporter protein [Hexamita inflata]|uniref:ZIP zinc transporter protein n=1 Tax=Hexamita inflata TaxID=28002 RepID=A0AA86TVZ0_9EUKA|nr:ZIP zinc transporter protein [Hexamita inflata]